MSSLSHFTFLDKLTVTIVCRFLTSQQLEEITGIHRCSYLLPRECVSKACQVMASSHLIGLFNNGLIGQFRSQELDTNGLYDVYKKTFFVHNTTHLCPVPVI